MPCITFIYIRVWSDTVRYILHTTTGHIFCLHASHTHHPHTLWCAAEILWRIPPLYIRGSVYVFMSMLLSNYASNTHLFNQLLWPFYTTWGFQGVSPQRLHHTEQTKQTSREQNSKFLTFVSLFLRAGFLILLFPCASFPTTPPGLCFLPFPFISSRLKKINRKTC